MMGNAGHLYDIVGLINFDDLLMRLRSLFGKSILIQAEDAIGAGLVLEGH